MLGKEADQKLDIRCALTETQRLNIYEQQSTPGRLHEAEA